MCGKFTAMASWSEVVHFSEAFSSTDRAGDNDRSVTFRVMSDLPVIIWDGVAGKRRVVPMRWGFPKKDNWRIPQPIHARDDTIDSKYPFKVPFHRGQRGIVMVKTFNEGRQIMPKTTEQHTIEMGGVAGVGIAFLFDTFEVPGPPDWLTACVMATVPANTLVRTLSTEHSESDRMPALLANNDWSTWLGENGATPTDAKACLKTVEGVNWTMTKEERAASTTRRKPTVRDPTGFL